MLWTCQTNSCPTVREDERFLGGRFSVVCRLWRDDGWYFLYLVDFAYCGEFSGLYIFFYQSHECVVFIREMFCSLPLHAHFCEVSKSFAFFALSFPSWAVSRPVSVVGTMCGRTAALACFCLLTLGVWCSRFCFCLSSIVFSDVSWLLLSEVRLCKSHYFLWGAVTDL